MLRRISLLVLTLLSFTAGFGQDTGYWPSPEVEQMYKQAKEALSRGAIRQSIVLFQQAIQLAPGVIVLHRDLAQAYSLAKEYDEAYKTVEPIIKNDQADELTYQIAGSALLSKGERRKARNLLNKGIKAYPNSGILYHELGKYYEAGNDLEYAADAWLQGIQVDPAYHLNYYDAARVYLNTSKPVWTVIYGEIFVNLERHTGRSQEMRKLMLQAYKSLFSAPAGETPKYGKAVTEGEEASFEAAVMQLLLQLAPVVSDGITTENLVMLRTRFVMDWRSSFSEQYPFSLFRYHDQLLRDGEFDAYNQWLFGMAENPRTFESWTKFHPLALPELERWVKANRYQPVAGDFYNDKELRSLFLRRKRG